MEYEAVTYRHSQLNLETLIQGKIQTEVLACIIHSSNIIKCSLLIYKLVVQTFKDLKHDSFVVSQI